MNIASQHHHAQAGEELLEAVVGFDMGPQVTGWYFDSQRWNGWLNPWITRESVELIQGYFNSSDIPEDRIDLTWNPDGSLHLLEVMWHNEDPEGYPGMTITPDELPDGTQVYQYLSFGYCWSTTDQPAGTVL